MICTMSSSFIIPEATLRSDIMTLVETAKARDRNPPTVPVPCPHVRLALDAHLLRRATTA